MNPKPEPNLADLWYADGLAFECQRCGRCCGGAPGSVWVTEKDIKAIAEHLGLSEKIFTAQYLRRKRGKWCLRERPNWDCVLLDPQTRSCIAYELRPLQCRTWPWWRENLINLETWEYCRGECPGIDKGKSHPVEHIHAEMRREDEEDKK